MCPYLYKNKNKQIMYLTENQENKIYREVTNYFESNNGEVTNCETKYVTEELNYFYFCTEDLTDVKVTFKTKNGKLLKRSLK
tara:strand:- start:5060 stop:5305 length:246 start_codon:yes stop_codon:yes gene_type:complete